MFDFFRDALIKKNYFFFFIFSLIRFLNYGDILNLFFVAWDFFGRHFQTSSDPGDVVERKAIRPEGPCF